MKTKYHQAMRLNTLFHIKHNVSLVDSAIELEKFLLQYYNDIDNTHQAREVHKLSQVQKEYIQRDMFYNGNIINSISFNTFDEVDFINNIKDNPDKYRDIVKTIIHQEGVVLDEKHNVIPTNFIYHPKVGKKVIEDPLYFSYRGESNIISALEQSNYCIYCAKREKDFCRSIGCPLDQKISEMIELFSQGHTLGAFAVAMIDNPLLILTGERICNSCSASCILQKQMSVNVPQIETAIVQSVLEKPWGFEAYKTLCLWNPLKKTYHMQQPSSNNTVVVIGLGPAGIAFSYYMLHLGHNVIALEASKIDSDTGFGGVLEYGVTNRWNKKMLKVAKDLLQSYDNFRMHDNIRVSPDMQIDCSHIAFACGAGAPVIHKDSESASSLLMALHLMKAYEENTSCALQIELPFVIAGCGLTAIDCAIEAKAYYVNQIQRFFAAYKKLDMSLSDAEQKTADKFIKHARQLQAVGMQHINKLIKQWGGIHILCRNTVEESAAYKSNPYEVKATLDSIIFHENITVDSYENNNVICNNGRFIIEAKQFYSAFGTYSKNQYPIENEFISHIGDIDPMFKGSVVKALASAKSKAFNINMKKSQSFEELDLYFSGYQSFVYDNKKIDDYTIELTIDSPMRASLWKPGQFFRIQRYGCLSEPIPVLPIYVKDSLIKFIIYEKGAGSYIISLAEKNEKIALMGPLGAPIDQHKNYTLIGGNILQSSLFGFLDKLLIDKIILTDIACHRSIVDLLYPHVPIRWVSNVYNECNDIIYTDNIIAIGCDFLPSCITLIQVPIQCATQGICGKCCYFEDNTIKFGCDNVWSNMQKRSISTLMEKFCYASIVRR